MGCSSSCSGQKQAAVQSKVPVLIFTLPGMAKRMFIDIAGPLISNLRFIDVPNSKPKRRLWPKDLAGRKDYAGIFFIADIRTRPMMLYNVRTLNWFIRTICNNNQVVFIVIYENEELKDDFARMVPKAVEFSYLKDNQSEDMDRVFQFVRDIETRYFDSKLSAVLSKSQFML